MKLKSLLAISLAISIVVVIVLVFLTGGRETIEELPRIRIQPHYLLIAVVIHAFTWVIWGLRVKILSGALGVKLSVQEATGIVGGSLLPAAVTPSHVGGEVVRIYLLHKKGVSYGDAAAITIGERVLDAILLFGAVPIGLFVFWNVMKNRPDLILVIGSSAILFTILGVLFVYTMIKPERAERLVNLFVKSEKWKGRIGEEVGKFRSTIIGYFKQGKKALGLAFVCTVVFWLLEFIVASFILLSLGRDPFWTYSMAAQTLLIVFILVPVTPGGSGMMELLTFALYGSEAFGLPREILFSFIVIWRFITYHMNIIISAIFDIKILKDIDKVLK